MIPATSSIMVTVVDVQATNSIPFETVTSPLIQLTPSQAVVDVGRVQCQSELVAAIIVPIVIVFVVIVISITIIVIILWRQHKGKSDR